MDNLGDELQYKVQQIIGLSVERYGLGTTLHALAYVLPTHDYEQLEISWTVSVISRLKISGLTPDIALKIADSLSSYKDYFVQQAERILADKARRTQGIDKATKFIQEMQKELT